MKFKRIRDLREDNDLTQKQVAEKLNVTQQTYSDYELGRITITAEVLIKLSSIYGVSVDYILGLKDEKWFSLLMRLPLIGSLIE